MYACCLWCFGHGHVVTDGMICPENGNLIIPHSCYDLPVLEADSLNRMASYDYILIRPYTLLLH